MDKIPLEMCSEESQMRFRDCFSVRYIMSAAVLCRLVYSIEKNYRENGAVPAELSLRHEAFCLSAILSSVAFLESTINELYSDAADNAYFFNDIDNETLLKNIGEKWNNENYFDRTPMVLKYQKILAIAEKPLFDENDPVFSDIHTLIDIRNYLIHYRREWIVVPMGNVSGDRRESQGEKFEKKLENKFAENPLASKNQPFFPEKCFGHGCAEWAVKTCLAFTDEFFCKLNLPAPYDGVKDELQTRTP